MLANVCRRHLQSFSILQEDFLAALGSVSVSGGNHICLLAEALYLSCWNKWILKGKSTFPHLICLKKKVKSVYRLQQVMLQCAICGYEYDISVVLSNQHFFFSTTQLYDGMFYFHQRQGGISKTTFAFCSYNRCCFFLANMSQLFSLFCLNIFFFCNSFMCFDLGQNTLKPTVNTLRQSYSAAGKKRSCK